MLRYPVWYPPRTDRSLRMTINKPKVAVGMYVRPCSPSHPPHSASLQRRRGVVALLRSSWGVTVVFSFTSSSFGTGRHYRRHCSFRSPTSQQHQHHHFIAQIHNHRPLSPPPSSIASFAIRSVVIRASSACPKSSIATRKQ